MSSTHVASPVPRTPKRSRPGILFLVPTDLQALERKGVRHLILERDEGGFFRCVVSVHPFATQEQSLHLDDVHEIHEFQYTPGPLPRIIGWVLLLLHLTRSVGHVRRFLRANHIDLIRAQDAWFCGLIGWICSRLPPRRPFCISIHADYDKRFELAGSAEAPVLLGSRPLARRIETFLLKRADLVMPIRPSLARNLAARGVPPDRIRVIPHGIDLQPFREECRMDIPDRLGLPRGKKIVSFVGRLSADNYIDDVIMVARGLGRRGDSVVVLAGDGDAEDRIQHERAQDEILFHTLHPVGFQPRDVVIALRRQSTVALCPMGGFSLIEAAAAGTPVVAYDVEWHSELIEHGKSGFLLPEHAADGLLRSTEALLDDPDLARRLGKAARERAFEHHDLVRTRERKRTCYRELLQTDSAFRTEHAPCARE